MSNTRQANVIFAIHFDDIDDPRYKEVTKLLMGAEMWRGGNLVSATAFDSADEMRDALDKIAASEK